MIMNLNLNVIEPRECYLGYLAPQIEKLGTVFAAEQSIKDVPVDKELLKLRESAEADQMNRVFLTNICSQQHFSLT